MSAKLQEIAARRNQLIDLISVVPPDALTMMALLDVVSGMAAFLSNGHNQELLHVALEKYLALALKSNAEVDMAAVLDSLKAKL